LRNARARTRASQRPAVEQQLKLPADDLRRSGGDRGQLGVEVAGRHGDRRGQEIGDVTVRGQQIEREAERPVVSHVPETLQLLRRRPRQRAA
jgi:hypothetical protein